MFSSEFAEDLIKLPKYINELNNPKLIIEFSNIWRLKFDLVGVINGDKYNFLFDVWENNKGYLKMNLHFQENDTSIGIYRVDFYGTHRNPTNIEETVPSFLHPYAGKSFAPEEAHAHYHVPNYKTLAWAIPLKDDSFPIKQRTKDNTEKIFYSFVKAINIQTKIKLNKGILK